MKLFEGLGLELMGMNEVVWGDVQWKWTERLRVFLARTQRRQVPACSPCPLPETRFQPPKDFVFDLVLFA